MIGWLLVLSFVLGFVLTGLYMIRSVTRTVQPVASATPGTVTVSSRVEAPRSSGSSRSVKFDDDLDVDERDR